MANRFYIAYGSNLNILQMQMRCPGAAVVGTASIRDYRLLFKGSRSGSYLSIEPWTGGRVPVVVWEVTEEDERRLDRFEGYPVFYHKLEMRLPVTLTASGAVHSVDGFVYLMCADRPLGRPDAAYLETCAEGYQSFGFDTQFLLEALANSTQEDSLCTTAKH